LSDPRARLFFRNPAIEIYYSRVTRKELLHPPISDAEKARVLRLLAGLRLINPDNQIAAAYSDLLSRYGALRAALSQGDRLISERLPPPALNSSLQRIGSPPILRR